MITPRTDQNAGYYYSHGIKKNSDLVIDPSGPFVLADFARELERENARLRYALKELVEQCRTGDDITAWWRAAVDRAEQALIALPNVKIREPRQ